MSTKIDQVQQYAANSHDVFVMLSDTSFIEKKCLASGSIEAQGSIEENPDGTTTIVGRRVLPAKLPSFAKSFVGETIELTETQNWTPAGTDQSRTADFSVDFGNNPITFSGTVRLKPSGDETTVQTKGVIRCSIPFVGGKIENLALSWIEKYLDKEQLVGNEWLSPNSEPESDSAE